MPTRATEPQLVVSLVFPRLDLALLHHVRRFVTGFLKARPHQVDAATISQLVVAAHELMENAIKYSTDGGATLEILIGLEGPQRLVVRTSNRAPPEGAARTRALLERLQTRGAQALYQDLLRETVHREEGSGLGLIRIAAECGMQLSERYADGMLVVDAWRPVPEPSGRKTPKKKLVKEIQ